MAVENTKISTITLLFLILSIIVMLQMGKLRNTENDVELN